jgi:hypothetical protein
MPNQPKTSTAKRTPPTPEQIIAEQKIQAEKLTNAKKAPAVALPARAANTAVATPVPDNRTNVQRYLDEVSPASIVGRLIKFSKDGNFILADTDEPVAENAEFVALCGETLVGWIRFHNDGETPPDRVQGLLYDGFQMPTRDTLGDLDETQWPEGPSGGPEDPWKHQMLLVLQDSQTRELFTYGTASITGRRAVGNLLRHYNRMRRANADELPVVRLKTSGFNSKKPGVGWVPTPTFAIVGRTPRDSAAKPDTSVAADLNDQIPI